MLQAGGMHPDAGVACCEAHALHGTVLFTCMVMFCSQITIPQLTTYHMTMTIMIKALNTPGTAAASESTIFFRPVSPGTHDINMCVRRLGGLTEHKVASGRLDEPRECRLE